MKIAIAGAGAMGSRFGFMLHQAGNDVILIDKWKDHINEIRKNGLKVNLNGERFTSHIPIYFPEEIAETNQKIDLILLFTKAMQLEDMLSALSTAIHSETKVLCLLNGIGHEDVIEKFMPKDNILIGITMWTAGLAGAGKAELIGDGSVELQNLAPKGKDYALEVVKILDQAGLHCKYSPDVRYSIWEKACVNGTVNGTCALLDATIAELGQTNVAISIIKNILHEFVLVAKQEHLILDEAAVLQKIIKTFDPNGIGNHYPSMHQDLVKNHRLTEVDYINGVVIRKGEKYGIDTPFCTLLTELIHAKEQLIGAK